MFGEKNFLQIMAMHLIFFKSHYEMNTPQKKILSSSVPNSRPVFSDFKVKLASELISFLDVKNTSTSETCKKYMTQYQTACHKYDPEIANEIYTAAKEVVNVFFSNVNLGKDTVRKIEQENATSNVMNPLPLRYFEQIKAYILDILNVRNIDDQMRILRLCLTHHATWKSCYEGRKMYRMTCEKKRDEGHNMAYWIFKLASLISVIVIENSS